MFAPPWPIQCTVRQEQTILTGQDVTIYVPCYGSEATIGPCLEALRSLRVPPARLLVIDDGSPTPVADRIDRRGVEIIRHEINRGLGAARNTALAATRTALIAGIDSDVAVDDRWLERALEAMHESGAAGFGGAMYERNQEDLGDRWRARHMAQHWGTRPVVNPRFLYGCNTLFRVEALRAVGGYDDRLRSNDEDRLVCEALHAAGMTTFYSPTAACWHLRRDTVRSILPGYWKWHHARGLLRGDFDDVETLIRRIEPVNFGIFRYRYDIDEAAKEIDLLGLDALIPWVFSALDLRFAALRHCAAVMAFPDQELVSLAPPDAAAVINALVSPLFAGLRLRPCDQRYLDAFRHCLTSKGWFDRCGSIGPLLAELRGERSSCAA